MTLEQVEKSTILRGLVGSTVHGLNVNDGLEDRDEMGVCVEDLNSVVGLQPFEQIVFRSAALREGRPDAKSKAGDLDLVIYSLRKYVRLALGGNPTVLNLLFVPIKQLVTYNKLGLELQGMAHEIVSKKAGKAFLGYLQHQRERLVGERGQKDVNRPELVMKYGFDTKYAMHMLRLGYQGIELMNTGYLSLPMPEPERSWLVGVRNGNVKLEDCLERAKELEEELKDLLTSSHLPDKPNTPLVEKWMINTYFDKWQLDNKRPGMTRITWQNGVRYVNGWPDA